MYNRHLEVDDQFKISFQFKKMIDTNTFEKNSNKLYKKSIFFISKNKHFELFINFKNKKI
ncbi:hypothetical protein BpHYR1_000583 [Brachionus plicatilis]|uniref:Uncharacterized protein n=1 Tax=Brachionus plicatilis TaxID=10195 RepID=A0A3M7RG40_BRAPC|nr:hypothetical protein BpHYR1_000583 [Brachionus plicatilis]